MKTKHRRTETHREMLWAALEWKISALPSWWSFLVKNQTQKILFLFAFHAIIDHTDTRCFFEHKQNKEQNQKNCTLLASTKLLDHLTSRSATLDRNDADASSGLASFVKLPSITITQILGIVFFLILYNAHLSHCVKKKEARARWCKVACAPLNGRAATESRDASRRVNSPTAAAAAAFSPPPHLVSLSLPPRTLVFSNAACCSPLSLKGLPQLEGADSFKRTIFRGDRFIQIGLLIGAGCFCITTRRMRDCSKVSRKRDTLEHRKRIYIRNFTPRAKFFGVEF